MKINPLKLAGTFEITLNRIGDARGYFMETFSHRIFAENGIEAGWLQENQSLSSRRGIVRGLHFQVPPMAQAKLVRAVEGEILDVFVDVRKESATFGQWDSVHLSAENCKAVFIPHGFAHGFATLSDNVIVQYKVDNYYSPEHDSGLYWNDSEIGINWKIIEPLLSEKDGKLPFLKDFVSPF
jgi:dTDP-4-dehydrorhamnose 3,5-epimerase